MMITHLLVVDIWAFMQYAMEVSYLRSKQLSKNIDIFQQLAH
jgi:hypothetical protein